MKKVLFEERQRYAPWVVWTVAIFFMALVVVVWYDFFERSDWQEDWDQDRIGHAVVTVLVPLIGALNVWLVASYNLYVQVDEEGISFSMFPIVRKTERIDRGEIAGYQVRKLSFWEYSMSGGERKILSRKKRIHIISSWKVTDLTLVNGKRVMLGTKNPEEFERVVKKLLSTSG